MLSEKMAEALNRQLNAELYSAYLYLSMAAYFYDQGLNGFANWMVVQNQEETLHAMKFFNYLKDRGARIRLAAIEQPPTDWSSPLEVFEATLKHEQKVTSLINQLMDLALAERDHATTVFLQWFVTEQVEEEASANDIVQRLRLIGNDANALFVLDRELATRVFTPPTTTT